MAPVLRRTQWPWHLLTAVALVIGGLTKLNSQLVALCGVLAWALHAGSVRRVEWPRVLVTLGFAGLCGVVLPVTIELLWTKATPGAWWYNVVALPFGSRSGDFAAVLDWKFYFTIRHGYYGSLPVPQLGALGMLATAAFAVTGIRTLGWRQGPWVIAAAGFAAAAGAGLLATNYEIAYVAMGAWFALLAALWLGFELRGTGRWFYGGLVAPVLVVGALAWHSAWQGQRSQFGYSHADRAEYVAGETITPDFAYMKGTVLPPEVATSMHAAADWRSALPAEVRDRIFYGPGLEWLERVWPALKVEGMSLWMHKGTSYGDAEAARLMEALSPAGPYACVLVPGAWDQWKYLVTPELAGKYVRRGLGPVWFCYEKLPREIVSSRPAEFQRTFGGDVNATQLRSDMRLAQLSDGRSFLGVARGTGEMRLIQPSYRARGEAVLMRSPGKSVTAAAFVTFEVFSLVGGEDFLRWSEDLILPEGQSELVVPFSLDCGGSTLRFVVKVPPEVSGQVVAGWRGLRLLHSPDGPEAPLQLQPEAAEAKPADAAARRVLLPEGWTPPAVYLRDGRAGPGGVELSPGGEIWIRLAGTFREITGTATRAEAGDLHAEPVVRVFYAKGAKLAVLSQSVVGGPDRRFDFKVWSPEPDGWLVIVNDPGKLALPVTLRLISVKTAD
jgi:hypothetical protein